MKRQANHNSAGGRKKAHRPYRERLVVRADQVPKILHWCSPARAAKPRATSAARGRAEDGNGWIVRLYETGRKPETQAVLTLDFIKPQTVKLTNLVAEDMADLKLDGNAVKVTLKTNELLTLRVK